LNPEYLMRMVDRADLRPYLNDEQFEFRRSVARVLQKHATPEYLRMCDEQKRFPAELVATGVEQDWFALTLPEEFGGIGGYMDMAAFLEVAAYHSIGLTRFWNVSVNMVGGAIARFADDRIKRAVLPGLVRGRNWFAFALSENGSGSDAAALTTRAIADGDDFVVDGTKMWITGAAQASYILTAVRTDPQAKKHEGISLLLIPTDAAGV
jgi:alkylation response protein AidB-like acyl-CoA dehydrogenase